MKPFACLARPKVALATGLTVLALITAAPGHSQAPDGQALATTFGEVCIPERFSHDGTVALAHELGWQAVVAGENAEYDRFIAHAEARLAEEVAEDPDLIQGSESAWLTRDIGGRPHLLAVSLLLTSVMDTLGCYIYDFAANAPIDPEPVTNLLGQEVAYTTDGDDPFFAVDPQLLVTTVWGPPPGLPRTGDTYLTFIPESSAVAGETGFAGLMLKFSTSLPSWEDRQK